MSHLSEKSSILEKQETVFYNIADIERSDFAENDVTLFWLPAHRSASDAHLSQASFRCIASKCESMTEKAVVCILTTPPDAAQLLPYLEKALKFQIWVAVKTVNNFPVEINEQLPSHHASLLILTRSRKALDHTKTRIGYTYCPACLKTTKDYGGKKHIYHEYGTLMSDVWRDIECDPDCNIVAVVDRLCDVFSLEPHKKFLLVDLRGCRELMPDKDSKISEAKLLLEWAAADLPSASLLLNADCIEALKTLPDNSIDFCFTDPPYNIKKKYDNWSDALEMVKYFEWRDQWLAELYRVLKPGRTLAVLNIPQWAVRHYQYLNSTMTYQSWIVWEGLGLPVRMIMPAHYTILCFSKGTPRSLPGLSHEVTQPDEVAYLEPLQDFYCIRSSCITDRQRRGVNDRNKVTDLWSDIHRLKHNSRRVDHPCQLPPLLMRRLYALFTKPDETVLDCFDGAGTSTLVAHQMGRNFVGIELSEKYHAIAKCRHEQISRGEDPFGKIDAVPTAKNSRVQRVVKQKYSISKKELQLDVRRISRKLGRLPTRQEVSTLSEYPIDFFDNYFSSWAEVCAAARTTGMSEVPKEDGQPAPQLTLFVD